MPAITAAINPVNAVNAVSTASSSAGNISNDTPDRSFSSVLAAQANRAQKSEPRSTPSTDKKPAVKEDQKEIQDSSSVPVKSNATDEAQTPTIFPAEFQPTDMADDSGGFPLMASPDLVSAAMVPVALATQGDARNTAALQGDALLSKDVIVGRLAVNADGAESSDLGNSLTSGVSRPTTSSSPLVADVLPAKLAVADVLALPAAESRGKQLFDFQTPMGEVLVTPSAINSTVSNGISSTATQVAQYHVAAEVGTNQWGNALGNSLVVMSGAGHDRAELVLTPPQLGRIEVSIAVKGDDANAVFISANPAVREALENAMPRLREILADAGITLGQAHVGAESRDQSTGEGQTGDNANRRTFAGMGDQGQAAPDVNQGALMQRYTLRSLVDIYA